MPLSGGRLPGGQLPGGPAPLGAFDLHAPIGRGGAGMVWRGVHRDSGVPIAVKVLHPAAWREPGAMAAFRNEVRSIAALDHPGIVWIHDTGQVGAETSDATEGEVEEGSPYFVMEYASGGTLADHVPTQWPDVCGLILGLLRALGHAHAHGLVHRDLKPGNVLRALPSDLRPGWKLTDFGIAAGVEATMERSIATELVGTLAYMAPEQIRGEWRDYGPWTDLYALGCLLYRVVGHQRPFGAVRGPGLISAHLTARPQLLEPKMAVPADFDAWVACLLEKEPQRRFHSAAEAERMLLQLGSAVQLSGQPGELLPRPPLLEDEQGTVELEGPTEVVRGGAPHSSSLIPDDWRTLEPQLRAPRDVRAGLTLFGVRTIPFVGRLTERELLWDRLRTVVIRGRAEVVVIRGATGVGKTRLARWLGETAHARAGLPFLTGEARAGEAPQEALARPFRRWFRTVRLPLEARKQRLERLLGSARPELASAAAAMLGGESQAGLALGPEGRYAVARQMLEQIAGSRGAVLLLDDAQIAQDLLRFATHLLRAQAVRPVPVLLLLVLHEPSPLLESSQTGSELGELLARPASTELTVRPLSRDDHEKLISVMVQLESTLSAQLAERTAGNPMHAVEIVRGWVSSGRLVAREGGFQLEGPEPDVAPLPEVWRDRLKRLFVGLPPGSRPLLERAAALGTVVDEEEWQRVCDDPKGTFAAKGQIRFLPESAALRDELRKRLIAEGLAVDTDQGWAFVHELFRETLLTLAGAASRLGSHHRACARMLLYRPDSRRHAERIGRHLLKGGRPQDAIPHLVEAYRQRLRSQGDRAALPLLGEIEGALTLGETPPDDPRWIELATRRAEVFLRMERWEDARRSATEAERLAAMPEHKLLRARAAHVLGHVRLHHGELSEADVALARAEGLVREGEDPRLLGSIHAARSLCAEGLGDPPRARGHAVLAAQYLGQAGERRGLAEAWVVLGERSLRHGALDEAEKAFERAQKLQARLGNPVGEGQCHASLAEVAAARGDLEQARTSWAKALARFQEGGSPSVLHAILGLARTELARRDWVEAHRLASQVLAEVEPGSGGLEAACHAVLVAATAAMRDWSAFDVHLERVATALERFGVRDPEIVKCLLLALARAEAAEEGRRARQARLVAGRAGLAG
jgi:serine/threonine protein kinase/tetratricopeptide (TPR) repeat protein